MSITIDACDRELKNHQRCLPLALLNEQSSIQYCSESSECLKKYSLSCDLCWLLLKLLICQINVSSSPKIVKKVVQFLDIAKFPICVPFHFKAVKFNRLNRKSDLKKMEVLRNSFQLSERRLTSLTNENSK